MSLVFNIRDGKIGVMPTDTIYGIVGSALNPDTVEEIYKLRKRTSDKPMIILISSIKDLEKFDVNLTVKQKDFLKKIWPNPVSVVLPCKGENFKYLHRGTKSLAFRIPRDSMLLKILRQTGPLVAPSANFEGEKPSENISDAKNYFGDQVDFYLDGGEISSIPSTLIELKEAEVRVLRQGNFRITSKIKQGQMKN